ncbi:HlyD family type I secretion periplasmic adaptor subunit [Methylibium petroleiphilum]|uniref:HlyD family type I secretion periplasmic adaptor subunit n=1 Tax=Methylibium petroleiphilum TaxID=105560 RepID=UPI001ACB8D38|nr:HlyD family type I secretion periplasmic adaptor subunit [Methylibium petroleiphilum]MBN9204804.1 HlyD family type I secretion periplasmic adaptor subunit [Methylibium petroleiphilum]
MSAAEGSTPRHPALELLSHYRAVLRATWERRHELAGPRRLADETAFLPAALSLQETPAHPAPRRLAIALCALFVIALAWAMLGQVDIVAVAPGRIVVSERTKTLQPLEASVVKRVLVKDGDAVQAGQVLVELDATNATADQASVQEQLASVVSEELRTTALLSALRTNRAPALPPSPAPAGEGRGEGGIHTERTSITTQLQAEWQDITARLAKLAAERARREAELVTVRALIAKLEATLPIAMQREADFRRLTEQGFVSSHAGQDRTRERVEQESDLAMQRARLAEARAALQEAEQARAAYLAETQRTLGERQAQASLKREQFTQERSKTEQRSRLTQLSAPVAGTVQQVAVHTEGGVVTPAQVLMVIVPKDAEVTAEVVIDNKDIGFVNAGQAAAIKLETFPFTRYGTVDATVKSVTADAVSDEKKGAIFPATLTLQRAGIDIDGKRIALSPGMNLTAEIKTGRRRVIEYLLSPVQRHVMESMKER